MIASDRILEPAEVKYLHDLYQAITSEPWFTKDPKSAELFASRLVMFYQTLDIPHDRFTGFARTHATKNFRRKIRFEEDIAQHDH